MTRSPAAVISFVLLSALLLPGACVAGPNQDGVLIVHANESVAYSAGSDYCGAAGLATCESADTQIEIGVETMWFVVAAFPVGATPAVAGVSFGIVENDPGALAIIDHAGCASYESSDPTWPSAGTGTVLGFNSTRTSTLVTLYWFYGYAYGDARFEVGAHPVHGGYFSDSSIPARLDPIASFGALGFGAAQGALACPPAIPPALLGACCFEGGACGVRTAEACLSGGGTYQGDDTTCSPNPCPQPPPLGACCMESGSCRLRSAAVCASEGGEFEGAGTDCLPNPCPQPLGACCALDGTCTVIPEYLCNPDIWTVGIECDPNPCRQPPSACCFADGSCQVLDSDWCAQEGGTYQGVDVPCSAELCAPPTGTCCLPAGDCLVLTEQACLADSGVWGDGVCDPNPCPQPSACCLPTGECVSLLEGTCHSGGGLWIPGPVGCAPDPCPIPIGACCLLAYCTPMTEDECHGFGGTYQGNGVICGAETCVASGVADALVAHGGVWASPNPSSGNTTITFVLGAKAWATVQIHDAAGRLIRTLDVGVKESGLHSVEWDGRADTGDEVRAGVYFVRIVSGAVALRKRVVRW